MNKCPPIGQSKLLHYITMNQIELFLSFAVNLTARSVNTPADNSVFSELFQRMQVEVGSSLNCTTHLHVDRVVDTSRH